MNLKAGLFSLLSGFSGITALAGTRFYPITVPENPTLPAIRYLYVGGSSDPTFETSGLQKLRIQFDCLGATADDADALRTALIQALNGYRGALSDGTYLQLADLLGPGTDFFDNDARQYRCIVEFYLYFDFA